MFSCISTTIVEMDAQTKFEFEMIYDWLPYIAS